MLRRKMIFLPDHPHAGGENNVISAPMGTDLGPSPRGWGEQPHQVQPEQRASDHPHAGGENAATSKVDTNGVRTIPTRVGKTYSGNQNSSFGADHPHAGGENAASVSKPMTQHGPSPRGWGELALPAHRKWPRRTIPTRVGKTNEGTRSVASRGDHPHAGGENGSIAMNSGVMNGPSPRGWGKLGGPGLDQEQRRTIPTRVGKTPRPAPARVAVRTIPTRVGKTYNEAPNT